ncbi:MlaD family protein [Haloechinothrix salitolerans]|uniref:MlaD family protein n=1 Tax=Haloechinothrix salitolerans TaxID=926830 RepID=A0ABW2BUU7_9PSEU
MLTWSTRIKLLAFGLIAVVSVVFVGGKYAGLDRLLGPRGYVVTAELTDSGGIFRGSEVTYRGVTVGTVSALRLTDRGVDVELDIDEDAPPIPADTDAVVANRSAVGEQYLDLRPDGPGGPFLANGSVIEAKRIDAPVAPETMLTHVDQLIGSINTRSLNTIVDEAYVAFADSGDDLQLLLDSAHEFTTSARKNMPATRQLLSSARTVLDTQRRHADDLGQFASGLKTISRQFAKSDPDLRAIIDRAPGVANEVSEFIDVSGNDTAMLVANLLTTADVAAPRTDSMKQLMVNFAVIGAFARTVSEDGRGHLGLVFDMFNPPSCTRGYEGTKQRPANDVSEVEPNKDAYCAEPPGSPISVRGAQNAPYRGVPQAVPVPQRRGSGSDDSGAGDGLPGLLGLPGLSSKPAGIADLLGGG